MSKTNLFFFSIIFLLTKFTYCQTKIFGSIKDSDSNISFVNIVLKPKGKDVIVDYAVSDEKGNYIMETDKTGEFSLLFSSLGYQMKTISIEIDGTKKEINVDVILAKKPFELEEVVVQSEKPISIKKDTITFITKYFVQGNEQTVEELLKKIPGISIDRDGNIKVGNQEIEKLMIDGEDFFGKGYKILSKNMPAYPIEQVVLLENYSNNRLLKGIEESNKVALNLKLDEKSKRIWFGNIKAGYGNNDFYEFKTNLMNFGKKNKFYFLTNFNNTGKDVIGEIDELIRPFNIDEPSSIGDEQRVDNLLDLSAMPLNLNKNRTSLNNAELLSLNAIFNPDEKLKIKTLGFFYWNETDFYRKTIDVVDINSVSFTNIENYKLRKKNRVGFGKIDLTYDISKTQMLETVTKYNDGTGKGQSNLLFNDVSTIENLKSNNILFDQKISYINKFRANKVFLLTGRFIVGKTPQSYSINRFFYQDLFPNAANVDNVRQLSKNQMQFAGLEAHLLDRKQNGDLLELQLGNAYRKDFLKSSFILLNNTTVSEKPMGYQNDIIYRSNDLYLKSKYRLEIKDFAITGKLDFHQLFNQIENSTISLSQNPFFVNPSIGLGWEPNENNQFILSYSYNTTNAKILDVYNNFVLMGFRSFSKGTGNFEQLKASSIFFNYQLGNWSDRFFAHTTFLYLKNHNFFSSNTLISQNYSQSEKILIKDRTFLSASSELNYYFKFISSNLKLDLSYTKSDFKNIVNNSNYREVASNNYSYGLEVRSGFNGIFNYHIGTKWTTNKIESTIKNSFTDNITFLDLSFVFNDRFDFQLQSERYYFGNLETDDTYYFLDFETRYYLIKNKLTIGITGKNLFNTEKFKNFSINDVGTSTTEYRLLPRFILLKLEYRF